jgi:hypothetical protein
MMLAARLVMHKSLSFFGVVYSMESSVVEGETSAAHDVGMGMVTDIDMPPTPPLSSPPVRDFEPPGCRYRVRESSIPW